MIIAEGKLLLLYREDENWWEVPGGKVEKGESPTEAAVRETEEEIGVKPVLEKPFYSGEFQKDEEIFLWHGYLAETQGKPEIKEEKFSEMKYFTAKDLENHELAPNLEMVRPALRKILD